jgi:hypothetical protein
MDLTLNELVVLKETPFPGDLLSGRNSDNRSNIVQRAHKRLDESDLEPRALLAALDQLAARGYVERVSIGFFRRTYEGQVALTRNSRSLQSLVSRLVG